MIGPRPAGPPFARPLIPFSPPPSVPLLGARLSIFGVLLFAAALVTYGAVALRGRAVSVAAPRVVDRFARALLLGGLAGAHTAGILMEHGLPALGRPALFLSSEGAFSSGGGLAAGALAGAVYLRLSGRALLPWADVVAWAFPFGLLLARAGCALVHDHPGMLSSSWLAVRFPGGARLDCGLLEWMAAPPLVALAVALGRRRLAPGRLAASVGGAYSVVRLSLDFLRARDLPGSDPRFAGLTFAQWVCLLLLGGCAHVLLRGRGAGPERAPS